MTLGPEERILRRFAALAKAGGPSAVVMSELARELGMSTKTVYRHFPTKAHLVVRLVERWAERLERQLSDETATSAGPYFDQLLSASEVWQANRRRFGPAFWDELERDHPEAAALVTDARARFRRRLLERLAPHLRPTLPSEFAMELLDACLARATDPATLRRLGIGERTAVAAALRVWSDGALVEPLPRRPRSSPKRAVPARD